MRNRLRGTLLSAAAGVAAAVAPAGEAAAQPPMVTPGVEPVPGRRYSVPQGAMPFAGPADMAAALPPGMSPPPRPMAGPGRPMGGPAGAAGLLPDSLRPHPRISPYEHRFDQTFHDGNLWHREMNNSPRRYYGSAGALFGKFKPANRTTIGSRRTLQEVLDELFTPQVVGAGLNSPTLSGDTLDLVSGPIFRIPWVKSAFIPNPPIGGIQPVSYDFYGLGLVNQLDPSGFVLNGGPRLVPFLDSDIDVLPDDVSPDLGTVADATDDTIVFDAFGYVPLTGDVFSTDDNRQLIPGFAGFFSEEFEDADNPGLRGRFGFEEADGSGFEWTADWLSEDADVFSRGDRGNAMRFFEDLTNFNGFDGPVGTRPAIVARPDLDFRTLPLGVIVVDADPNLFNARLNGTPIARPLNAGFTVLTAEEPTLAAFTYDLLYENEFAAEQASTEMSFIFTPLLKKGKMRVRPSFGLRFNYLNERYSFRGLDSGSIQVLNSIGETVTPSVGGVAGTPPGPGIINPFTGSVFLDETSGEFFIDDLIPYFPYQSDLVNEVQSYLFGPQAGLHLDMEGKFLSVRGHVKAGVAGLQERIRVEGQGFNLNQHITADPMPFRDEQNHSRVSPFLDANIRGEANLFPYVPVLNRVKYLKNARLTGGFSVTSFWEISRPLDAVIWREANSGNPYVNDDSDARSQLYFTNWDVGVAWKW